MRASVDIGAELANRIERLADKYRQPTDKFIRDAVEEHVKRLEMRDGFIEEADASWEAYKHDGLHLTGDEVIGWLNKVTADDEAPMPDCHR